MEYIGGYYEKMTYEVVCEPFINLEYPPNPSIDISVVKIKNGVSYIPVQLFLISSSGIISIVNVEFIENAI